MINKVILRMAICDGVFSNPQNQIRPALKITSDVLAAVSNMTDDQVNAILTTYTLQKKAALQKALSSGQANVTQINQALSNLGS